MENGSRLLIDSNAIIEAHRLRCWSNLINFFHIETAQKCIEECASGNQQRRNYVPVDTVALQASIQVHEANQSMRSDLLLQEPSAVDIHDGERDLLAYALTQKEKIFLLCSPDKACMRVAAKMGFLNSLVSLESLALNVGLRKLNYRENYTEEWHARERTLIVLEIT